MSKISFIVILVLASSCARQGTPNPAMSGLPSSLSTSSFPTGVTQANPQGGQLQSPVNTQGQDLTANFSGTYGGLVSRTYYNGTQGTQTYSMTLMTAPVQYNGQTVNMLAMQFVSPAQTSDPITFGAVNFSAYLGFYSSSTEYYWFQSSIVQQTYAPNFQDSAFSMALLFDLPAGQQIPTQLWLYVESCGLYQGVSCSSTAQDVQLSNATIRR